MLSENWIEELESFWKFTPKGEPGDWERCHCDCHCSYKNGMPQMMHCVPCCFGGWKKTFQLLAKEMAELQERQARDCQTATTYKPAHGGYPG